MDPRQIILDAIERIAPDIDVASLPPDVDVRKEAELDSMDFLGVLTTVQEQTGVEIPEADYGQITTVDQFTEYLGTRLASAGGR